MSTPLVSPGDRVGVISPSAGLPAMFPEVYELGLERMRELLGVQIVEYPSTRRANASLQDRAIDIMSAFADSETKAVFTSIGGLDQIQLLHLLDPQVFLQNPKPFFGYSDNTHLHNFLWRLGIPTYYGAAVMTQFGMHHAMFDMTIRSIKHALLERKQVSLYSSHEYNDIGLNWSDPSVLGQRREMETNEGWFWDGEGIAEGKLWGGCVESMIPLLGSNRWAPTDTEMDGVVLFLETAEDIPESWIVQYVLIAMGERGWFDRISGVLIGRPKAWEFDKPNPLATKAAYRSEQRETVVTTIRQYNTTIPIVQNLDFGHTDPQIVVPSGRPAAIDCEAKSIAFDYS